MSSAASGNVCAVSSARFAARCVLVLAARTKGQNAGENVACRTVNTGVASAIGPIQTQLMNSPGHRANILNPLFNRAGVGVASVPSSLGGTYIVVFETQVFVKLP